MQFATPRRRDSGRERRPVWESASNLAAVVARCPLYAGSPALEFPDLAAAAGVAAVVAKDERWRFGLPSFKALGAGYAVLTTAVGE
ncbi:MAG TPA: hypothetical protein VG939_19125, partial [Caulobacteraceae bacterium]|nr:hypothetical protein [Caulobacteraceae bacterium]